MFKRKYVLSISFAIQAGIFVLVGLEGVKKEASMESHLAVFCILFGIVAASQSVVVSCIVGTVGAWTKRSSRGILTGIWATCGAVGNIVGL